MKKLIKLLLISLVLLILIPIAIRLLDNLFLKWDRIHVKDNFFIEYLYSSESPSLWNETQVFVTNVQEAYWNKNAIVVSGENGCFLIKFEETKYNDEMISIGCADLKHFLKKPIQKYVRNSKKN